MTENIHVPPHCIQQQEIWHLISALQVKTRGKHIFQGKEPWVGSGFLFLLAPFLRQSFPSTIIFFFLCCTQKEQARSSVVFPFYLYQVLAAAPWSCWWTLIFCKCPLCTAHAFLCSWSASPPALAQLAPRWSAGRAPRQTVEMRARDHTDGEEKNAKELNFFSSFQNSFRLNSFQKATCQRSGCFKPSSLPASHKQRRTGHPWTLTSTCYFAVTSSLTNVHSPSLQHKIRLWACTWSHKHLGFLHWTTTPWLQCS